MAFAKRNQNSKNLQESTNEILNASEMVENYSPGSPIPKQKTKKFAVRNFVTKYGSPTKKNKRQSVNKALKNKAKK